MYKLQAPQNLDPSLISGVNFTKFRTVNTKFIPADGWTDITKLIGDFRCLCEHTHKLAAFSFMFCYTDQRHSWAWQDAQSPEGEWFRKVMYYRQKHYKWVYSLPSARLYRVICFIKVIFVVTFTGITYHSHVSTYLPGNLKQTSYCGLIIQCLIWQIARSIINNVLSLKLLLHVSIFSRSSPWRCIQKHKSTANYVKDLLVQLNCNILH